VSCDPPGHQYVGSTEALFTVTVGGWPLEQAAASVSSAARSTGTRSTARMICARFEQRVL